jgi:hypothetical protein
MYHKKAKLFLLLIAVSIQLFAQSPDPNAVQCIPCSKKGAQPTSVPTDVKPTDACYPALKNLIERYGIDVSFCSDGTFNAEAKFTNGMWLKMLSSSIFRFNELIEVQFPEDKNLDSTTKENNQIKKSILKSQYFIDTYNHKFTTISQVKDVDEKDECYFFDASYLIESYGLDFTNKEGLLDANEAISKDNVCKILKTIWVLQKFDEEKYQNANFTKADFVIMFNDALEEYQEILNTYQNEKLK